MEVCPGSLLDAQIDQGVGSFEKLVHRKNSFQSIGGYSPPPGDLRGIRSAGVALDDLEDRRIGAVDVLKHGMVSFHESGRTGPLPGHMCMWPEAG